MKIGRACDGAFEVWTTGSTVRDGHLIVTVELRRRWWSWRYWRLMWAIRRAA